MGRAWVLVLAVAAAGCLTTQQAKKANLLDRLRPAAGDGPFVEVALIEQPAGDHYLNQRVWSSLDEQVLPPLTRSLLEENGLRVGLVGRVVPAPLQTLLTSPRSNISSNRLHRPAGQPIVVPVNGPLAECEYEVLAQLDGKPAAVRLENAQFGLAVTPELLPDGRVKLRCEPQVQHGEKRFLPKPNAEGTGWSIQGQRPLEKHAALAFDVTAVANEWVVVGLAGEKDASVGAAYFLADNQGVPVQRLLLMRAGQTK
jgi:hypothetical protein